MKRIFLLVLFFPLSFCVLGQNWLYRESNNISNLHINDFSQDSQGVIWIATAKGLCRYDGMSYNVFCHLSQNTQSIASDNVNALYFDGANLWCATGCGVSMFDVDKWKFTNYRIDNGIPKYCLGFFVIRKKLFAYGYGGIYEVDKKTRQLTSRLALEGQVVQSALVDSYGRIWIVCDGEEVLCLDAFMNLNRKIAFNRNNEVYCMYQMPNNNILLGTKSGSVVIDKKTFTFSPKVPTALAHIPIKYIKGYVRGKVVFGTKSNELHFFDFYTGMFTRFPNIDEALQSKVVDLTCAYIDRSRNLWLGTFNNGVKMLSHKKKIFNSDYHLTESLKDKFVTRISDDHCGHLWIGTRYGGLIKYNIHTHETVEYSSETSAMFAQNGNFIQSLFIDSKRRLWSCNERSLLVFDVSDGFPRLLKEFTNVGNIVTIAEDAQKRIWTGSSFNGIMIYDDNLRVFKSFLPATGKSNNITKIIPFSASTMMFSAFGDNVYYIDINTLRTRVLSPRYSNLLKNVVNMKKVSGNQLCIGTYGDGLLVYSFPHRTMKVFGYADGLRSNDILGVEEDKRGWVWVSSSNGLYRMNISKGQVFAYFSDSGTSGDQYHEKSECVTDNGELIFGGNYGVTQISTDNITSTSCDIPVLLTDLKVFNKSVPISADSSHGILKRHISRTKEIVLKHNENVFSIDFIGLIYETPKNIEYAYQLEGFDTEWNYSGGYNRASYSNLPSDTYKFKVKIKNGSDKWEKEQVLLTITVLPSPWMQPVAILCYIALCVSVLLLINRLYIRQRLKKERAIMDNNEIRREKRLAQMKVNFFTNISHELRTPLTMIYNPVKLLQKDGSIKSEESRQLLELIVRNSERLLKLVDQILDYGRLKNDTLKLKVSSNNCVTQILDIVNVYKLYAAEKNISVLLNCPYNSLIVFYDTDKLDKILNNLLFNALKYTPMGGHVVVTVSMEQHKQEDEGRPTFYNSLKIVVEDDGNGVEESLLPDIFDRFTRMVKGDMTKVKGSGVGLNYVKHLVTNHKGIITAANRADKGMAFTVILPVDEAAYTDEEILFKDAKCILSSQNQEIEEPEEIVTEFDNERENRKHILVVEDNNDMIILLRTIVYKHYDVDAAVDGVDALEKIKENEPDLVISDVMMPRMDGFTLCGMIKADAQMCHIPVILLTAKTLDGDKIQGYRKGADMYLNKPFNPDLLLSMIDNIFRRSSYRQDIIARTSGNNLSVQQKEREQVKEEMSPLDKRFLEKLDRYIDTHISNSELNVNILGRELGFSRTNFYRKVKSLTGMPPNDFLRVYRLNRAVELIKLREYSLNEISDMVGFGTQSHFSSCFKRHFGVSPKDYLSGG